MRLENKILVGASIVTMSMVLAGCASQNAYQKAFSNEAALSGNSKTFAVPIRQTLDVVKQTLIHQGFTIEQADASTGLIKAMRNYQDPSDNAVSYHINVTADITANLANEATSDVSLAASQQTVLHREWHDWWHLLWIIPLFPTGTEYQTVVTKEGNVTDAAFYNDFFSAVAKGLHKAGTTAAADPTAPITSTSKTTSSP